MGKAGEDKICTVARAGLFGRHADRAQMDMLANTVGKEGCIRLERVSNTKLKGVSLFLVGIGVPKET